MKNVPRIKLIAVLSFILSSPSPAQYNKLPDSAKKMLDKMPGKVLTPDYVVAVGMKNASSFKRILANHPATEIPILKKEAELGWLLTGQALYLEDFTEKATSSIPTFPHMTQYTLGVSKSFSTGTQSNLSWSLNHQRQRFLGMPEIRYKESELKLELTQSLWKDFLGKGTRKEIQSALLQKNSAELEILNQAEQWVLALVDLYFQAWLAQQNTRSALENLARKRKLLKSTLAKYKRGTAEKPEKLQIESSVNSARADYWQKNQVLHNTWHALVVSLSLPRELLQIDPALIPIKMPEVPKTDICSKPELIKESLASQKASLDAEIAKLSRAASHSKFGPDLSAFTSLSSNSIDSSQLTAIRESAQFKNLEWGIGLKLALPLGFKADKATIRANIAQEKAAKSTLMNEQENLEISSRDNCESIETLAKTKKILTTTAKKQRLRARLEQERFDIGRSNMFNVIQASDDAAIAELNLMQIQVQMQTSHWNLQQLSGELSSKIKKQLEQLK